MKKDVETGAPGATGALVLPPVVQASQADEGTALQESLFTTVQGKPFRSSSALTQPVLVRQACIKTRCKKYFVDDL